jgi:hypothetical protein
MKAEDVRVGMKVRRREGVTVATVWGIHGDMLWLSSPELIMPITRHVSDYEPAPEVFEVGKRYSRDGGQELYEVVAKSGAEVIGWRIRLGERSAWFSRDDSYRHRFTEVPD